jgi:2-(1,2-epoxy-1,2-dihydrophenyl)acetyl-CoA isomerase
VTAPAAETPSDAAAGSEIRKELRAGVLWLTIDRPGAGNALTSDNRLVLADAFAAADRDPGIRAVVLTATGARHFCTGADLRAGQPAPPRPEGAPEQIAGDVARGIRVNAQRLISAILDCEKPVIAAVNGTTAGMGVQVALACDFVIASETARFIEIFVRRALVPDSGAAYLLPRLIGVPRAKELLMLGDDVSAARAYEIGLVYRVVPADELIAEATALAERLAAGPTRALALTKWLVNRSLESSRAASFEDEAIAQDLNMHTADGQEGVRSFVERRPAEYRGW